MEGRMDGSEDALNPGWMGYPGFWFGFLLWMKETSGFHSWKEEEEEEAWGGTGRGLGGWSLSLPGRICGGMEVVSLFLSLWMVLWMVLWLVLWLVLWCRGWCCG